VSDSRSCVCRVCGSPDVSYLCETYNGHSKTRLLDNYICNECGSVFIGNNIDAEELGVAYSTLDPKSYYEEIEPDNRKKMATAARHLAGLISPDADIIDIGTGNGLFVKVLHENGFKNVSAHEIQGSDLSEIKDTANRIFQDSDYSSIPSAGFNAVTLLDVVEHVPDPKYLIRMCARILKQDGVIYLHTPVVTRTDRMMHLIQKIPVLKKAGIIWQRGRTSIFHLANYTERSLTLLLKEAGFDDIRIEIRNELSWPVTRYVKVFLLELQGWPGFLAPFIAPFFYPFLSTDIFNANKAIVSARKTKTSAQAKP